MNRKILKAPRDGNGQSLRAASVIPRGTLMTASSPARPLAASRSDAATAILVAGLVAGTVDVFAAAAINHAPPAIIMSSSPRACSGRRP